MGAVPLSFLDPGHARIRIDPSEPTRMPNAQDALADTIRTAQALESLGFQRYWVGEHHVETNMHASPEILATILACNTQSIRIGTAGVLTPYQSAHRIAENFRALGNWFPGRFDAGIAKGPGADKSVREHLLKEDGYNPEVFRADLRVIANLLSGAPQRPISPSDAPAMDLWCHSGNLDTIAEAAKLGLGIGVALFFSQDRTPERYERTGRAIEKQYIENFEPGPFGDKPRIIAVDSMICIENEGIVEAVRQLSSRGPWGDGLVGTPEQCANHIETIMQGLGATEFGVLQSPYCGNLIIRSASLLTETLGSNGTTDRANAEAIMEPATT